MKDYGDVSNAFGSPSFESLDAAVQQMVQPQDVSVAKQRFLCAFCMMESATGTLALHARQGGLAGDPFMVVVFRVMYNPPMDEWEKELAARQRHEQNVVLKVDWDGENSSWSRIFLDKRDLKKTEDDCA